MMKTTVIEKLKAHWKVCLCLLAILAIGFAFYLRRPPNEKINPLVSPDQLTVPKTEQSTEKNLAKSSEEITTVVVDVKGQVKNPAVYQVAKTARVDDVVKLAGGLTDQADVKSINLAQKVTDEMVIYIASIGEAVTATQPPASVNQSQGATLVNINTADLTQLQTLSGIGVKKAQDIIDYREQNGKFNSVDELKNISGFGEKTVEKLKDDITVD
ncbi:MAG: helix-hairpin-helix domain-containing protein [Streptococcaceae bacterium]|jgi:competence protein ComEA|nr:helix-hairpin-helix domain-containing protein [Streptococcaceae bacterium]